LKDETKTRIVIILMLILLASPYIASTVINYFVYHDSPSADFISLREDISLSIKILVCIIIFFISKDNS
jgi:uncharacterized Tic20 family protein